jgi:uncharacterized protein YdaU (DUF1376 family)
MPDKLPPEVLEFFRSAGKKGGKKRASKMTAEQRSASARKAAQARWKRKKKQDQGQ